MDHSFLPPSGAAAWSACAMWPTMNRAYPQDDTPDTIEGRAAHHVATEIANGVFVEPGSMTIGNVVVTDEMIEGGELYRDAIRRAVGDNCADLHFEKRIKIPQINEICFGTPDFWAQPGTGRIPVIDYKFGHRFVDEFENAQLIAYGAGVLNELSERTGKPIGLIDQEIIFDFTVVQPRCYSRGNPVRTWSVRASDLRGHINKLKMAADAALAPDPSATTNSECDLCPGRHACSAYQDSAYLSAEFSSKSAIAPLSFENACIELRMLERAAARLDGRISGLRQQVMSAIQFEGKQSGLYGLDRSGGRLKWKPDADVGMIKAFGEMFGVNLTKETPITPTQAIKLGIDETVIKSYSYNQPGEIKLVQIDNTEARRVFSTMKG